jgi:transcriptional regulator with XRE-family HTH domain
MQLELARFGEKLRRLRMSRSLTLDQLASQLGYSTHSYLDEIELGKKKPTAEFALKISRFFNVTTDSLLKDEVELHPTGKDDSSG